MRSAGGRPRVPRRRVIVVGLLLLSFGARLHGLGAHGLRLEEARSAYAATRNAPWAGAGLSDLGSPLYDVLLRMTAARIGDGEARRHAGRVGRKRGCLHGATGTRQQQGDPHHRPDQHSNNCEHDEQFYERKTELSWTQHATVPYGLEPPPKSRLEA